MALGVLVWTVGMTSAVYAFDCEFPSERRTSLGFAALLAAVGSVSSMGVAAYAVDACLHDRAFSNEAKAYACVDVGLQVMLVACVCCFLKCVR